MSSPIYAPRALALLILVTLSSCATEAPLIFQLIDRNEAISVGRLSPAEQRIEVVIGNHRYEGFYVIDSGVATSRVWPSRRGLPIDTTTNYQSNSARASLRSEDGRHLACEFLVQDERAVGECRTTDGIYYHLVSEK